MNGYCYFILGILILAAGYFTYGRVLEKIFRPDASRQTPVSYTHLDVYKRQAFTRIPSPNFLATSVAMKAVKLEIPAFAAAYPATRVMGRKAAMLEDVYKRQL